MCIYIYRIYSTLINRHYRYFIFKIYLNHLVYVYVVYVSLINRHYRVTIFSDIFIFKYRIVIYSWNVLSIFKRR